MGCVVNQCGVLMLLFFVWVAASMQAINRAVFGRRSPKLRTVEESYLDITEVDSQP